MSVYDREYHYTVHEGSSPVEFQTACKKIEDNYPMLEKEKLLTDIDGTTIQIYKQGDKEVTVYNDYDFIGDVFILSDIDLGALFRRTEWYHFQMEE